MLAKDPDRVEQGDQQCDRGLADHAQDIDPISPFVDHAHGTQGVEAGIHEDECQRQQQDGDHLAEAWQLAGRDGRRVGKARRQRQVELLAGPQAIQIGTQIPGRDGDEQADYGQQADVGAEQLTGGNGAGVGGHEGVHHREGARRRQCIFEHRATKLLGHAEDDGQHDDEARIEEDGEAKQQGGHTERKRSAMGTEAADQGIGQHLGAARHLQDPAYHGAETDQQGHPGQGATEAAQHGRYDLIVGHTGGEGRDQADQRQGDEGVDLEAHYQQQQHDNCTACYRKQVGDIGGISHTFHNFSILKSSSYRLAQICAPLHMSSRYR
ncbi:hypothetical protein D3C78_793340 [compost metagenome]